MGDPLAMRRQVRFTEQRGRCKFFSITMQYRPASGDINIKQHPVQTTSRESDMAVTQAIPITRHPYANGSYKKMLIDGQWVDAASGKTFETLNPATGEVLATVAEGDAEDINRAVAAARRAFEGPWSKVKPFERQSLLLKLADLVEKNFEELSQLDTLDMGAPISRTRGNKLRVLGMLRYYAGQATALHGETIENSLPGDIFSYTLKEPVGVVGAIIPWNGPLGASVWKIGPAIATGCTVILKPAEEAPLTSLRLAELCMEAGIPPGVVNVVPGYGETAGAALASHPGVDKVAFTGSHVTGQSIVRASAGNLKRVSLELGGKSPDIVFADADLDAAVPGAAMAVFANSGQICSAGTRLFVESTIYDEFVGRVAEFGKKLQVGNGLDPNTQIGPLVSQQQLDRVSGYLDIGQKEGAKALAGGTRLTDGALSKGYFVPPTVFANVQDSMRIAQEEIFGPVISAISFKDSDDLIKRANATTFGLGSGVWTTNVSKAHQVAKSLRAGSVWVNCYQAMDPAVPFGGYKMSGYGRESGKQHLEEYLNVKAVWIKTG
jgi:aldehyde dehydrogenase (NAD+)